MKELPKNPNVRPPYSDVYQELEYYTGQICELLGISRKGMGEYEWRQLGLKLKALDRAMLRCRAVLDPVCMSDKDWLDVKENAFALMTRLLQGD